MPQSEPWTSTHDSCFDTPPSTVANEGQERLLISVAQFPHAQRHSALSPMISHVPATQRSRGPHGGLLNEIVEHTNTADDCAVVFGTLKERIESPPSQWRKVYKALVVLEFLVRPPFCFPTIHYSPRVLTDRRAEIRRPSPPGRMSRRHGVATRR